MKLKFIFNSESGAVVAVDQIMQKPCGLVVVGEISNGTLTKGDSIRIRVTDKKPIYDGLKRIEFNHEEVMKASKGQLIGLCLERTSKAALIEYFGK